MRRRNPRAGLTLLEVMIALWITAAAALVMASVTGFMARALDRVEAEGDVERISARIALRRWLEAMPEGAVLTGDAESLRFATPAVVPDGVAGLGEVVVAVDGGGVVVRAEGQRPEWLARQGSLASIRYWGAPFPDMAEGWRDDWPEGAALLPGLVRIDYAEGGQPLPPLTVVPARLARQGEMSLSSPEPPG